MPEPIQSSLTLLPGNYSVRQLANGNLKVTETDKTLWDNLKHNVNKDFLKNAISRTGHSYELNKHEGSNFRINIAGDSLSESHVKVEKLQPGTNLEFGGNANAQDRLNIDVWKSKGAQVSFNPEGDSTHNDQVKINRL